MEQHQDEMLELHEQEETAEAEAAAAAQRAAHAAAMEEANLDGRSPSKECFRCSAPRRSCLQLPRKRARCSCRFVE
jgi:hypothetical protein